MSRSDFNKESTNSVAPNILLTDTSRWPATARLAIALSQAGCNVSALCPIPSHPLTKVRTIRQTFRYSSLRPLVSLIAAIKTTQPEIIIPCDDTAVQQLHELYAQARSLGPSGKHIVSLLERSLGEPKSFPVVASRDDLLSLARAAGISIPKTKLIESLDDLKTCHASASHPLVLKADGTWGGNGVRIAHTPQQAEQHLLELTQPPGILAVIKRLLLNRDRFWLRSWWRRAKPSIISQDYIAGRPANCAAFAWQGQVLAVIGVEAVTTRYDNGPATVVRVVNNPQMQLAAQRIARHLHLSGFFGLDFMIEHSTNKTYLIEMNPRGTQLCHLQLGQGRDMIAALAAQLSGQPLQESPPATQNDLIAYFPEAWLCKSEFLDSSFHDIPHTEPALIKDLLKPSSDRTFLGRIVDSLRRLRPQRTPQPLRFSSRTTNASLLQPGTEN